MAKKITTTERDELSAKLSIKGTSRKLTAADFLSTGLTALNLALSGLAQGGIAKGTYIHLVGDSDSGKTVLALTAFSEAARNSSFDNYRFIFWNAEDGALMDLPKFYGRKAVARIEEQSPETLEDFYYSMDDAIKEAETNGKPFVGILDSMDALYPKAWVKKFAKQKSAARSKAAEEAAGDYGTAKAKINSENLRRLRSKLRRTGSILIIISQTRDNVASGPSFGDKKSVSGGRTLKFYSTAQVWTSTRDTLKKSVMGAQRAYGIRMQIEIKKNHINGKKGRVYGCVLNDSGVDDTGSNVDYLIVEGYWKSSAKEEGKGKITAKEFSEVPVGRDKLIKIIEDGNKEKELRQLVRKVWIEIEEAMKTERKARYE